MKVHALKSSARVIGALELSERAKRLEDAGNSNYIMNTNCPTMKQHAINRLKTLPLSLIGTKLIRYLTTLLKLIIVAL